MITITNFQPIEININFTMKRMHRIIEFVEFIKCFY